MSEPITVGGVLVVLGIIVGLIAVMGFAYFILWIIAQGFRH